ncbi:MAG: DNA translocase FtsK, partial [Candidatus Marinimicrobia bacterium]|nr:DNA translocase FtsK [Candidatus Neomarinimicrobiota bacterium]
VPSKGYVGIEVPNEEAALVALRDLIESNAFQRMKSSLSFALGQDVAGNTVAADLAAMPHLLIAGATGSGKSVCVNSFICCLLLNNTPDDLRLIMVDPKRVELTGYNGIPHLLAPVVVELERVIGALQWVAREMDQRYHKLAQVGVRNITEYNAHLIEQGEKKLPLLVIIIDELADLMMLAPDETERTVTRLAQLARATGIHLIISTQRPSTNVVTGLIKANFPARIAFQVATKVDSRTIIDQMGAEKLLGRGDLLYLPPGKSEPQRLHAAYISLKEINDILGFIDSQPSPEEIFLPESQDEAAGAEGGQNGEHDELFEDAARLVIAHRQASVSMLQRRFRIGYSRAGRLVDELEWAGIISGYSGSKAREVLVDESYLEELKGNYDD